MVYKAKSSVSAEEFARNNFLDMTTGIFSFLRVSLPDNDSRPKIKVFVHNIQQLFLCFLGCSVSEQWNRQWMSNPNGIRNLWEKRPLSQPINTARQANSGQQKKAFIYESSYENWGLSFTSHICTICLCRKKKRKFWKCWGLWITLSPIIQSPHAHFHDSLRGLRAQEMSRKIGN